METIRLMRRELTKLNNIISKKDKTINKLENESINLKTQKELNNIKNEMNKMQIEYEYLQNKYNSVVNENVELNSIFDDVENTCDSD
jgi:prefoldin subunit 5